MKLTCLMTSLRPGQRPPHVTIAAFTSSGLKYIFSRGPARWTLEWFNTTSANKWSSCQTKSSITWKRTGTIIYLIQISIIYSFSNIKIQRMLKGLSSYCPQALTLKNFRITNIKTNKHPPLFHPSTIRINTFSTSWRRGRVVYGLKVSTKKKKCTWGIVSTVFL